MNALYLDIGNTSLKLAKSVRKEWEVLWHKPLENDFESFRALLMKSASNGRGIVYTSSVRKDIARRIEQETSGINIQILSTSQIPSHLINYNTISTLGLDRFLGCLGAFNFSNKGGVIVIDTGSACTVDFMDKNGVYQGGVIMPGIDILKKSITTHLPELPDVEMNIPNHWPGKSTKDSLRWGVNGMFSAAIERWIGKYQMMDSEAEIFLTGGNSKDVQFLLAPDMVLIHHAHLHFEGMKLFAENIAV